MRVAVAAGFGGGGGSCRLIIIPRSFFRLADDILIFLTNLNLKTTKPGHMSESGCSLVFIKIFVRL